MIATTLHPYSSPLLPKELSQKDASYGYPLADTMNRHYCISPEEDAANARLIAAAPAMLEALIDAARDAGLEASCASKRDDDFSVKAWAELQNKLDVVIRLAKGETK